MMQGVQILRVHDVNEVNQSIKIFNSLKILKCQKNILEQMG